MLKKDITYLDYNDEEQTETFYFNLSKIELAEMDINEGGLEEILKDMIKTENTKDMYALFRKIILSSVGRKSADGSRFVKSEEIREDFVSSPAYDALFMELFTGGSDKVMEFITGMLPKELRGGVEQAIKQGAPFAPTPQIEHTNSPDLG